jgi:ankyrin repeat protein
LLKVYNYNKKTLMEIIMYKKILAFKSEPPSIQPSPAEGSKTVNLRKQWKVENGKRVAYLRQKEVARFVVPFVEAVQRGHLETMESHIQQLQQKGVNISIFVNTAYNGETALHWATRIKNQPIVEYLLSIGADPNVLAVKQFSALDVACGCECILLVQLLLTWGSNQPSKSALELIHIRKNPKLTALLSGS